jgi:hypothetical protein
VYQRTFQYHGRIVRRLAGCLGRRRRANRAGALVLGESHGGDRQQQGCAKKCSEIHQAPIFPKGASTLGKCCSQFHRNCPKKEAWARKVLDALWLGRNGSPFRTCYELWGECEGVFYSVRRCGARQGACRRTGWLPVRSVQRRMAPQQWPSRRGCPVRDMGVARLASGTPQGRRRPPCCNGTGGATHLIPKSITPSSASMRSAAGLFTPGACAMPYTEGRHMCMEASVADIARRDRFGDCSRGAA